MDFSIVVPVYNEEECIEASFDRLNSAIKTSILGKQDIEVIFVNDGSSDRTAEILSTFTTKSTEHLTYKVLHFSRNFGHSSAVLAGLEASTGHLVGIIDADMQDPPELIPDMIHKIEEGYDVVYGQRMSRGGETIFKRFTAWVFYRVMNTLSSVEIPKDAGDFRVMKREVVEAILSCEDQAPFIRGLVAWVGFKQFPLQYHREQRKLGTTKYPFIKMMKFAIVAITNFSNTPLVFITYLGLGMTIVSVIVGLSALRAKYLGLVIPGWTSLLIGFMAGNAVTLLMLGIMGLYLGKVIDQVRGRPRYIVKKQ